MPFATGAGWSTACQRPSWPVSRANRTTHPLHTATDSTAVFYRTVLVALPLYRTHAASLTVAASSCAVAIAISIGIREQSVLASIFMLHFTTMVRYALEQRHTHSNPTVKPRSMRLRQLPHSLPSYGPPGSALGSSPSTSACPRPWWMSKTTSIPSAPSSFASGTARPIPTTARPTIATTRAR